MPSEAFMQSVLNSESAAAARGEEELPAEPLVEEPDEVEEEQYQDDGSDEADDEGEQDPPQDDQEEAEEEPQVEAAYGSWDEEFGSPEEAYAAYQRAQKQERDNRAWGQEQSRARAAVERELQEARELLAYQQGRVESVESGDQLLPATSDEYREWVEEMVESGNPEQGLLQVRQHGEESGDWSYARMFTDIWGEDDPYRAASERTFVEMAASLQRSRMAREEQEEEYTGVAYDKQATVAVIDQARSMLTQHYPDLQVGSPVLVGAVEQIKQDVRLHEMLRSGVLEDVVWAIEVARDRHLARQPRRARASRASRDAVDAEKTRLPAGDGVRLNGRRQAVSAEVPVEVEDMMTQFSKWGMVREE